MRRWIAFASLALLNCADHAEDGASTVTASVEVEDENASEPTPLYIADPPPPDLLNLPEPSKQTEVIASLALASTQATTIARARVVALSHQAAMESVNGGPEEELEYTVLVSTTLDTFRGASAPSSELTFSYYAGDDSAPSVGDDAVFFGVDGPIGISLLQVHPVVDELIVVGDERWSADELRDHLNALEVSDAAL